MITILFVFLLLVLIFISYLLFLSLKRINDYENFIINFQRIVEYTTERMKQVDASGHYEADDETEFFFNQLKDLQLLLNDIFEVEEEELESGVKEEK